MTPPDSTGVGTTPLAPTAAARGSRKIDRKSIAFVRRYTPVFSAAFTTTPHAPPSPMSRQRTTRSERVPCSMVMSSSRNPTNSSPPTAPRPPMPAPTSRARAAPTRASNRHSSTTTPTAAPAAANRESSTTAGHAWLTTVTRARRGSSVTARRITSTTVGRPTVGTTRCRTRSPTAVTPASGRPAPVPRRTPPASRCPTSRPVRGGSPRPTRSTPGERPGSRPGCTA